MGRFFLSNHNKELQLTERWKIKFALFKSIKESEDWVHSISEIRENLSERTSINPFVPNAPFLYPVKTLENLTVFWCFQGVQEGCIGNEWVNFLKVILITVRFTLEGGAVLTLDSSHHQTARSG